MKSILFVLLLESLVVANNANADIYRHISPDGVICYTDAPVNRDSVLILREHRRIKNKAIKSKRRFTANSKSTQISSQPLASAEKHGHCSLPVHGWISSTVGLRYDPIDGELRNHRGVDIAIAEGTPVKPVAAGIVSYSGTRGGYGNIVIVEHNGGMTTLYAHNSVNLSATGDRVDENSTIALTGSTGRSTGPHLHFEAWLNGQNITRDFVGNRDSLHRDPGVKTAARKESTIRKVLMADGSVYLTNLPLVHP
ncbi:MAG: M23 family metallopeptidase [Geobacteraceae bacterium]